MKRWYALLFVLSTSCVSDAQPLMFAVVSGVRIQPADEAGDEWLHGHCVFHGVATAENTRDVIAAAQSRRANFAEPLSQSEEERGFWSKVISYDVAFFACTENPPF
jgi:hypothetical protein